MYRTPLILPEHTALAERQISVRAAGDSAAYPCTDHQFMAGRLGICGNFLYGWYKQLAISHTSFLMVDG